MDEYNYCKGPWHSIANSWQHTTIYDDDSGDPICRLDLEDWDVTEEIQDNLEAEQERVARLIAACPELVEALASIVFQTHDGPVLGRDACISTARALLTRIREGK